jgi:hypothetical protein
MYSDAIDEGNQMAHASPIRRWQERLTNWPTDLRDPVRMCCSGPRSCAQQPSAMNPETTASLLSVVPVLGSRLLPIGHRPAMTAARSVLTPREWIVAANKGKDLTANGTPIPASVRSVHPENCTNKGRIRGISAVRRTTTKCF